ncbi:hypothetical protein AAU61_15395 [Desulfocarbo indianensis]|nr:hypothetical protein AAU61_15395 [Desulfocarbo indianensis]
MLCGLFLAMLPATAAADSNYYKIGPGDILEIIVWREVAISRSDVLVRPDGRISLPLVDDVVAEGLTPMELKDVVAKNLRRYVEAPQVYVTVKDPGSQTVSILGNVQKAGRYPMLAPTNVLMALALAGGFNEWAHKDDIVIIRGAGAKQERLPFEYSEVISGKKPGQNIRLLPGDVIVVP